ncbi:MAG: autotransporter outer membrane beta-barrel domain-containing protein [Aeromonas veronii]
MNKIYKTVFNRALGVFQVAHEYARANSGQGRGAAAGGRIRIASPALRMLSALSLPLWFAGGAEAACINNGPDRNIQAKGPGSGCTISAPGPLVYKNLDLNNLPTNAVIEVDSGNSVDVNTANLTLEASGDGKHGIMLTGERSGVSLSSNSPGSVTKITTTGDHASGIYVKGPDFFFDSPSNHELQITTQGEGAHGIHILTEENRGGQVTPNNFKITTTGAGAHGVVMSGRPTTPGGAFAPQNSGTITVSGSEANGMVFENGARYTYFGAETINVAQAGSAMIVARGVGTEVTLQTKLLGTATAPDTWGLRVLDGAMARDTDGNFKLSGRALEVSGNGSVYGNVDGLQGSRVLVGAGGMLNYIKGSGGTELGSLEGAGTVRWNGSPLLIGVSSYGPNDSMVDNADFSGSFVDSGNGGIIKQGSLTQILSGTGNKVAQVYVEGGGTLKFTQNGVFETSGDYITYAGSTTEIGNRSSSLKIGGQFQQEAGATLKVQPGQADDFTSITADSAVLGGDLIVTGFTFSPGALNRASEVLGKDYTLIKTTGSTGIQGDFDKINTGGSGVDYLVTGTRKANLDRDYLLNFKLAWTDGGKTAGTGDFTLAEGTGFTMDRALTTQSVPAGGFDSGWLGDSLTKKGEGNLALAAVNRYTGRTTVERGHLRTLVSEAIAASSGLTMNGGNFSLAPGVTQTLQDLQGSAGSLSLSGGTLNLLQGSFAGVIDDGKRSTGGVDVPGGSLLKSGSGTLILTGDNTYTGSTTITKGTLQIGDGTTAGRLASARIINNDRLVFNLNGDAEYAGILALPDTGNPPSGEGSLTKMGSGTQTLSGSDSTQVSVDVKAGTLAFTQNGLFTTGNLTTRDGATTDIGQTGSFLIIGNRFTQENDATLRVTLGSNGTAGPQQVPDIQAISAQLGGKLFISGFQTGYLPAKASDILNTPYTLIRTTDGITGNFSNAPQDSIPSGIDYLTVGSSIGANDAPGGRGQDYNLRFNLAWTEGGQALGTGDFTLLRAADSFDVDLVLGDQTPPTGGFASRWDGTTLTKKGPGSLVLSAQNSYTGATTVESGNLFLAGNGTIARSRRVDLKNASSTLDLRFLGVGVVDGPSSATVNNLSGVTGSRIILAGDSDITPQTLSPKTLVIHNAANQDSTGNTLFAGVISDNGLGGRLTKTGTGTLILSGNNTYTGTTTITEGSLQIGDGGTTGSLQSTRIDNTGTLTFSRSNELAYTGTLSGTGTLIKDGVGSLILSGQTGYTGDTHLKAGTLVLDGSRGGAQLTSNIIGQSGSTFGLINGARLTGWIDPTHVNIDGASTWNMTANSIIDTMTLAGTVNFVAPASTPMAVGRTLTANNWVGQGGTVKLHSTLGNSASGNSASVTDKLILNGGTATGRTLLQVLNAGGLGDQTTGNGITIVDAINGATTESAAFSLAGNVVLAGPYRYTLKRGGTGAGAEDDWFLTSQQDNSGGGLPNYREETSLYPTLGSQGLAFANASLGTLHERIGSSTHPAEARNERRAWGRVLGEETRRTHGANLDASLTALQVGSDLWVHTEGEQRHSVGLYGTAGNGRGKAEHRNPKTGAERKAGSTDLDAYALGAYYTLLSDSGFYVDLVAQGNFLNNKSDSVNGMSLKSDADGWSLSAEAGKRYALNSGWAIEPQAQLSGHTLHLDNARDAAGSISFDTSRQDTLRLGTRLIHSWKSDNPTALQQGEAWLGASVLNSFNESGGARFAMATQGDVRFDSPEMGTRLRLQGAVDGNVSRNVSVNARLGYEQSLDSKGWNNWSGQVGVKIDF